MPTMCPACGNAVRSDEQFCRVCGRRVSIPSTGAAPAGTIASAQTSGKAIASLVFGLFLLFFPFSIIAIIFGHLSLSEIKKSAGRLTGRGMAIAGLALGYAGVAFIPIVLIIAAIAIPNFLRARIAANEATARGGVQTLMAAETSYASNHASQGYTCSLAELSAAGLISGQLAQGQRNGYAYELSGCQPDVDGKVSHYQVVAYPVRENQTGVRVFCADETETVKQDFGGSVQKCLESHE